MRILALSDIHGDVATLKRILSIEDGNYDLMLVLGDITDMSLGDYVGRAEEIVEVLDSEGTFVKAIPGNMDNEDVLKLLIDNRINLHKDMFTMADIDFVGFGGSMNSENSLDRANASSSPSGTTPFDTPFEPSDDERGQVLKTLLQRTSAPQRAIVSHHPPKNTLIDRTADGDQVGSDELRRIIENEDIRIVLSGHIHEAAGEDRLGDTVMVNPGAVQDGRYAILDVGEEINVELREC